MTLSLDDFGTGYSSLSYLQRLPVREVKIDRSFVLGLGGSRTRASSEALIRSIISLGANLGLRIVAEGIEDGRPHPVPAPARLSRRPGLRHRPSDAGARPRAVGAQPPAAERVAQPRALDRLTSSGTVRAATTVDRITTLVERRIASDSLSRINSSCRSAFDEAASRHTTSPVPVVA